MSDFPYPGLRPFQRDETDIFFGREEHTDQLLEHLGCERFLAVLGPSGCGKSSLVKTGLLAGLAAGFLNNGAWRVAELRPGSRPYARLAAALLQDEVLGADYLARHGGDEARAAAQVGLEKHLRRNSYSLHEILRASTSSADANQAGAFQLLILVDQFEEIFRFQHQADDEAAAFVALLLAAVQHPQVYVVLTMRSDFIGDCALFHGLPEAINQGLYLTPRLTREQLQDAIVEPARVFGGELEAALVSQLLNDADNDPDQLPLLQHALMRMWNLAAKDAHVREETRIHLDSAHYRQVGGLKNALSNHADAVFDSLDAEQRRAAEILFRALTELGPDNRAVRRPVQIAEVAALAGVDWQDMARIVEVFRRPGRSFLTPPPGVELGPDTVLDISHESLIRQWRRLQAWVEDESQAAALYRRLQQAALREAAGQGELWRGLDLENARAWWQRFQPGESWAARYSQGAAAE